MSDTLVALVPLAELSPGDECIIKGTVDRVEHGSVWLILDSDHLGRVARVAGDVLGIKTGESPNYGQNPWHGEFTDLSSKERKRIYNQRAHQKEKERERQDFELRSGRYGSVRPR